MPSVSVDTMTQSKRTGRKRRKTPAFKRVPLFCEQCGRVVFEDSEDYEWWLVGTAATGELVVRCPQHITEWTMRRAGKGRTQAAYRWKRLAKEQDKYDYSQMLYEPFFMDETW